MREGTIRGAGLRWRPSSADRADRQDPSLAFQSQHIEKVIDFLNMFERGEKTFSARSTAIFLMGRSLFFYAQKTVYKHLNILYNRGKLHRLGEEKKNHDKAAGV